MSDKSTLISFGFPESRVVKALKATSNAGLQPALDWLEKHQDDTDTAMDEDKPAEDVEELDEEEKKLVNQGEAKVRRLKLWLEHVERSAQSLTCLQCGKRFRNTALASYHGDKSGHDQFEESAEEIAPLTEEEKKAKLAELREKMAEKRATRQAQDAEDAKKNEALRRKGGQEQQQYQEDMKLKQAAKEAAQRKQDRLDDQKAKQRIREQIEADKKARAEKQAAEKAAREGKPAPAQVAPTGPSAAASAKVSDGSKASAMTRLQLRLPDGRPPVTTTVESTATLQSVEDWLRKEHSYDVAEVRFSTAFPRKVFSQAEKSKTMLELGLSPSSALMVL